MRSTAIQYVGIDVHQATLSWGIAGAGFLVPCAVGAAFFVWRRDLLANVIAHVTCDGLGLVVIPLLARP